MASAFGFFKQLVKTQPRLYQRSIHTSPVRFNTEEKLGSGFKKARSPHFSNRFVQIDGLPITATTQDVYRLARDTRVIQDKSVLDVVFCRNDEFNFRGRCIVLMNNEKDASAFVEYTNRRVLGGNILKATHPKLDDANPSSALNKFRRPELFSITDASSAAGRSVVITGLPSRTRPEHLLGYLRSKNFFPLEGESDNVIRLQSKEQSTVSKFLVKFDSESEAWRCVRSFHNSDFFFKQAKQNFKLRVNVAY